MGFTEGLAEAADAILTDLDGVTVTYTFKSDSSTTPITATKHDVENETAQDLDDRIAGTDSKSILWRVRFRSDTRAKVLGSGQISSITIWKFLVSDIATVNAGDTITETDGTIWTVI